MEHTIRFPGDAAALQSDERIRAARHEEGRKKRAALGIPRDDREWYDRRMIELRRENGTATPFHYTGEDVITWADGQETATEVDEFIRTFRNGLILNATMPDVVYTAEKQLELMNLWREIRDETYIAHRYVTDDGLTFLGPAAKLSDGPYGQRIFDAINEAYHHQANVRNAEHAYRRHVFMDRNADEYAARLERIKKADAYSELKGYILSIKDDARRHALMLENADLFADMTARLDADMAEEAGANGYVMRSYGTITRPESE